MTSASANVLGRNATPTKTSYRAAVSRIIRNVQGDSTDAELADQLGCSDGTISNARNQHSNLDGSILVRILNEFGPASLDPFLKLGATRGVPIEASCDSDALPSTAAAVHKLALARCPSGPAGPALSHCELLGMRNEVKQAIEALSAIQILIDKLEEGA